MDVEPKLLSAEEQVSYFELSDRDGFLMHESVFNLFAHVAAQAEQIAAYEAALKQFDERVMSMREEIAAKDADIGRLKELVRCSAQGLRNRGAIESCDFYYAQIAPQPKDQSHG